MREITPAEAQSEAVLIDVREDDEWAAGHAPTAVHNPLSAFDPAKVPSGAPVALVCKGGVRSARAAALLDQQGFETLNVSGGMMAWAAAGFPVVTDAGDPGEVV